MALAHNALFSILPFCVDERRQQPAEPIRPNLASDIAGSSRPLNCGPETPHVSRLSSDSRLDCAC
jgi:hypothetical protein